MLARVRTTPPAGSGAVKPLRQVAGRKPGQVTAIIEHAVAVQPQLHAAASCQCPDLKAGRLSDTPAPPAAAPQPVEWADPF